MRIVWKISWMKQSKLSIIYWKCKCFKVTDCFPQEETQFVNKVVSLLMRAKILLADNEMKHWNSFQFLCNLRKSLIFPFSYECSLTGSTLQSSQFLTSAYTIPDSPLFTTITPSTDTLEFTLDRNNDNVPPSLSSLHMQFWKGSCDAQCVFPFADAAVSATEVFYECQPYATGPNTTEC